MSGIDLNNSEEFIRDIKIFNDGKPGVVENVEVRIERKALDDISKKPDYKLIAGNGSGEVNEGFYYQKEDSKAWKAYQAGRLITLARGILGKDVKFPVWQNPTEVLDGVMNMIKPSLNQPFRVAVAYGTNRRPSQYISFKEFGSFIQPMSEPNTLTLERNDSLIKAPAPAATAASTLIPGVVGEVKNLDWMNTSK